MMGRLGKYFQGALSIPAMLKMTGREIIGWYDIYIYQLAEDDVISEKAKDKSGPIPSGKTLERLVKKKIDDWRSDN